MYINIKKPECDGTDGGYCVPFGVEILRGDCARCDASEWFRLYLKKTGEVNQSRERPDCVHAGRPRPDRPANACAKPRECHHQHTPEIVTRRMCGTCRYYEEGHR